MSMKRWLVGVILAGWAAMSASGAYNWTLYDDFRSDSLNTDKWSVEVDNSSATPTPFMGMLNCSATLDDGSCKVVATDASVYGMKADVSLGSVVNDSGIEIEVGLSNGGEGYLDFNMYEGVLYIGAWFSSEFGDDDILDALWSVTPAYNTAYTVAVIVEGGIIKCYVNDALIGESAPIAGLSATSFRVGTWSDVDGAYVSGAVDNVYVLQSYGTDFIADFDWDCWIYPEPGVNTFSSGTYPIYPKWWLGVENTDSDAVSLGSVSFHSTHLLHGFSSAPDATNGTSYTWNDIGMGVGEEFSVSAAQRSSKENINFPVTVVRDWSPRVITESTNVTITVTVTPTADWDELNLEMRLTTLIHSGERDWWAPNAHYFADLEYQSETHSDGSFEVDWSDSVSQDVEWTVDAPPVNQPITFTMTVYYDLRDGEGPVTIEPCVNFEGQLSADAGSESWNGGALDLGADGSVELSADPVQTGTHLPWYGIEFYSSAIINPQNWILSDHLSDVEISAGYALEDNEYSVGLDLTADAAISAVRVEAPFGSFDCDDDWDEWEGYLDFSLNAPLPLVDGDWIVTVTYTNGQKGSTTIPFTAADGVTPLENVESCPQLTSPNLRAKTCLLANPTQKWTLDAAFDAKATVAGIWTWREGMDEDAEVILTGADLAQQSIDSFPLEAGMEECGIFNAVIYEGVNADGVSYEVIKYAEHDFEACWVVDEYTDVVDALDLVAWYDLASGEAGFDLEVDVPSSNSIHGVHVTAPFGGFDCYWDWDDWEYEYEAPSLGERLDVNGIWTVVVEHENGCTFSTEVPFQTDNGADFPNVTTCPQLTSPNVSSSEPLFSDASQIWEWDGALDGNASHIFVGAWNALNDHDDFDVDVEITPSLLSYGPTALSAGVNEVWFFNGHIVRGDNAHGIPYEVLNAAGREYEVEVIDPEWDADLDHISNEWELKYFGSLTACDPADDTDGDGASNLEEFKAGTNPTNATSLFAVAVATETDGFSVNWTPQNGHEYTVYWTTNLTSGFLPLISGLKAPQSSFIDVIHAKDEKGFYQLGVERVNTDPMVVRNREIQIDGDVADWAGIALQFVDPVGDSSIYSGLDITGITVSKGVSNLFIKVDRVGTELPSDAGASMWIYLSSEVPGATDYALTYYRDEHMWSNAELFYETAEDDLNYADFVKVGDSYDGTVVYNATGTSIEFALPLSELHLRDHHSIICFTHHPVDGEWVRNGENEDNNSPAVIILP